MLGVRVGVLFVKRFTDQSPPSLYYIVYSSATPNSHDKLLITSSNRHVTKDILVYKGLTNTEDQFLSKNTTTGHYHYPSVLTSRSDAKSR